MAITRFIRGFIEKILPTPIEVIEGTIRLSQDGSLYQYIWISTKGHLSVFIGGALGFILGLINGLIPVASKFLDTSIQMIRTIPHLALIPLVILWFGIGEQAKIFLVALGVAFPIYLNTYHGIRNVDKGLIEMGKVYGLKRIFAVFTDFITRGVAVNLSWCTLCIRYHVDVANCG